jgi:chemosensory pili system protein ChpA (sensor histidine kinase/response regulator)
MKDWNILIVEDDHDGQQVISRILRYMGIRAEVASTAEEALEMMSGQKYTAAIVDLALPGMDGMTLMARIRSDAATAQMPCVMVTAYHSSQVKKQALDAGVDAYFAKPLDDTSFIRELGRLLNA